MAALRIEAKPAFRIAGRKIWIPGQDPEVFGAFWKESHENGLVARLKSIAAQNENSVTNGDVFGVSRVENDPDNRAFFFYIATELPDGMNVDDLETYVVPAHTWAIFSNRGELPLSLIEAEMYAFTKWLPTSRYRHANAPELEVYPANDAASVEFWLPIESGNFEM